MVPGLKGGVVAVTGLIALASFAPQTEVTAGPVGNDGSSLKEAAHDHFIRLKIVRVTPVERVAKYELLELRVQRWYGKIDKESLTRSRKHETQEFTILFPAAPGAAVKVGDIIDYRAVGYVAVN